MSLRVTRHRIEVAGRKALPSTITPGYLPEAVAVLLHNWADGFAIETRWSSDVATAISGAEDRRGLVDRPYRTFRVLWRGRDRDDALAVWLAAQRLAQQRLLVPVYPDAVHLTVDASAGASTLTAPIAGRRFFPGGLAVLHRTGRTTERKAVEFVRILEADPSADNDTLTLAAPLELDHPEHTRITPVFESELNLEASVAPVGGVAMDVVLELEEVIGEGALPAWIPPGDDPDVETFEQIPVLDLNPDRGAAIEGRVVRGADEVQRGRGVVITTGEDRARVSWRYSLRARTRETALPLLRFVDSRQGRVHPFWQVHPQRMFRLLSLGAAELVVAAVGRTEDLERFVRVLALETCTGLRVLRRVAGVEDLSDGTYRLALAHQLPPAVVALPVDQVHRVAPVYLSRFATDSYDENWITANAVDVGVATVELLREGRHGVPRYSDPIPPRLPESIEDLVFLGDSPEGLLQPNAAPAVSDGHEVGRWLDARGGIPAFLTSAGAINHGLDAKNGGFVRFANEGALGVKGEFQLSGRWWSNALGMTVIAVVQRRETEGYDAATDFLLSIHDGAPSGSADVLSWTASELRAFEDVGDADDLFAAPTTDILAPRAEWAIVAMRWKPGDHLRVFQAGRVLGEAPQSPEDLGGASPTTRLFRMAQDAGDVGSPDDSGVKTVMLFRRALEDDELDGIGQFLADRSATDPTQVPGLTWSRIR